MRVGFAGTPPFAVRALAAILDAGFDVPVVLTQPDRPSGRGLGLKPSAVKECALAAGLDVLQPRTLRSEEARAEALAVSLDVLVVAAYGIILPGAVLAWPRHGCINIHASLLPRWRGAAPIQRAILAGDAESGVTIMQMDAGLDTGPMIQQVHVPIGPAETAGTLHDRLASAGAAAVVAVLRRLDARDPIPARPQPVEGVTYAHKIEKHEAHIDWSADALGIDRTIRAFDPVPGASTSLDGELWKLWRASPLATHASAAAGTVVAARHDGIDVACGRGMLRVVELQPAGGRRGSAAAVVAGRRIAVGRRFGTP